MDARSYLGVTLNTNGIDGRWSQFVINGLRTLPLRRGDILDEIGESLDNVVPDMKLAQRPRCLASRANPEGKEASSIIISLAEQVTLKTLAFRNIILYNKRCTLRAFVLASPMSQS